MSVESTQSTTAPVASGRRRVVIVGSGFGGISAAKALADANVDITLVSKTDTFLFVPMLYQVATGGLNPGDVTHFLRSLRAQQPNLDVVHEHLMELDTDARTVRLLDDDSAEFDE